MFHSFGILTPQADSTDQIIVTPLTAVRQKPFFSARSDRRPAPIAKAREQQPRAAQPRADKRPRFAGLVMPPYF